MDFETAARMGEDEALNLCIAAIMERKLLRAGLHYGPNDRIPFYVGGDVGPNREILFDNRPDFQTPLTIRPQTFDLPTPGHESHYSSRVGWTIGTEPLFIRFTISVTPWIYTGHEFTVVDVLAHIDQSFTDFLNAGNNRAAAVSWRESHFPRRRINR